MTSDDLWRQWRHTFSALACINAARAQVDFGRMSTIAYSATALIELRSGDDLWSRLPLDREFFHRRTPDGHEYRSLQAVHFGERIERLAEHAFSDVRLR